MSCQMTEWVHLCSILTEESNSDTVSLNKDKLNDCNGEVVIRID